MADKTLNQFTQATARPGLLSLAFLRDPSLGAPQSRAFAFHYILESIQNGLTVLSMALSDPVSLSPSAGDMYIVNPTGAGGWVSQDNAVTIWDGAAWIFATPVEGWRVYDKNTNSIYEYSGSAWVVRQLSTLGYDNSTSGLTATEGQAAVDELAPGYGHIYTQASDAVSISTIGTTAQTLAFSNNGQSRQATNAAASNKITAGVAGDWKIDFGISFSTVAAGDAGLYTFIIQKNGVDTIGEVAREMSGSSDTGSCAISTILSLAATDDITVTIESDDGTNNDDITITNAQLSCIYLG